MAEREIPQELIEAEKQYKQAKEAADRAREAGQKVDEIESTRQEGIEVISDVKVAADQELSEATDEFTLSQEDLDRREGETLKEMTEIRNSLLAPEDRPIVEIDPRAKDEMLDAEIEEQGEPDNE